MEIVFIRHGQTDLNKSGRIQGSSVNLSLNKEGREYAEEAAKNFDPSEFDAVYVSPLDRAVETAEIFTKGQKNARRTNQREYFKISSKGFEE